MHNDLGINLFRGEKTEVSGYTGYVKTEEYFRSGSGSVGVSLRS